MDIKSATNQSNDPQYRKNAIQLTFSGVDKFVTRDVRKNIGRDIYFIQYTKEQVENFILNASKYRRQLRDISNNLYNLSHQYKRAIQYFASMPKFRYIVEPYGYDQDKVNKKTLKSQYNKILDYVENMNIEHEFSKILLTALIDDVFYGYEHEKKDSYFIQKIDPLYCQISSIQDGVFNYSFNFSYFDSYKERLLTYPQEFQDKYLIYKSDATMVWQELDSTKTICIKINEMIEYPYPPFAGVFEHIVEINDFKRLRRTRLKLQNYKLLIQKLPIRDDTDLNNDFMIDYDNMVMFHNQAAAVLPDEVGIITTPMDITEIKFERSGTPDQDGVKEAETGLFNGIGISELLFNASQSNSVGLNRSINADEAVVFVILRQFERWLNRKAKNTNFGNLSFRIHLLDITSYNEDEFFNRVIEGGTLGFPVKMLIGAAMGYTPSTIINMSFLENDVLGMPDKLIPLQSSHTQDGGAPTKSKVTDSGAKSRG